MPTYEYTGPQTRDGDPTPYGKGEQVTTVAGSIHDKRLAGSSDWKPVDDEAKKAVKAADSEG